MNHMNSLVAIRESIHNVAGLVRTAVVDEDDFQVWIITGQKRSHRRIKGIGFITGWHNDTDLWPPPIWLLDDDVFEPVQLRDRYPSQGV